MWGNGSPQTLLMGRLMVQPLWETDWQVLRKLNTELACGSWVYTPREMKIPIDTKACSRVFTAALLMRAKRQK